MSESRYLTVLYTANLAGQLDLLPKLFSLIQQERQEASGPVFLVDLGDTCVVESYLCRETQGRAPFIVLDGIGYDAAVIGGPEKTPIPVSALRSLGGRMVMPVVIWNRTREFTKRGIAFMLAPGAQEQAVDSNQIIRVDRSVVGPGEVGTSPPVLYDVPQGVLGRVDIAVDDWCVHAASHIEMTPELPPDSIVGTLLDFVAHEAQSAAPQEGGSP